MAAQLRQLLKGKHPKTGAKLGPPVTAPHLAASTGHEEDERRQETEQSQGEVGKPTLRERVRQKEAKHLVQAASNKRKIEEFLTANEIDDPDLVAFWTESIEQQHVTALSAGACSTLVNGHTRPLVGTAVEGEHLFNGVLHHENENRQNGSGHNGVLHHENENRQNGSDHNGVLLHENENRQNGSGHNGVLHHEKEQHTCSYMYLNRIRNESSHC